MKKEEIVERMRRINIEVAHHHWAMINFPSIDGKKQRSAMIEDLKSKFNGLKWKLGEIEFKEENP